MSSSALHRRIAIVGMSCQLPGAEDIDAYWSLLSGGENAIGEMPAHRLDRALYHTEEKGVRGKTYSSIGGLVQDAAPQAGDDQFDPCHRLFADVARDAMRGVAKGSTPADGGRVGVFVGHSGGSPLFGDVTLAALAEQLCHPLSDTAEFQALDAKTRTELLAKAVARLRADRARRSAAGPHTESRWAAELTARELGLSGPTFVLDAACSSSLVALELGALGLALGDFDMAVVGGASYAQTNSLILFSQAQSCSARGSSPFDEKADGLVASEGYVALVLKTEDRAIADGDDILAVVSGIGMSTDGRGRHLWAPQKEGQTAAMKRAYGSVIDPSTVQYLEMHATSTQVGDATEISSIVEFFGDRLPAPIPIGSVKSNIGHTLETAGLAGLLKVVLAIRHGVIPPTINVDQPNRTVEWEGIPFQIARTAREWHRPEGDVRRAGVSAFGIGGLNLHIVVEEAGLSDGAESGSRAKNVWAQDASPEPIVVVGRGVVLPGAHNVGDFFARVRRGESAILDEPPRSRWPAGFPAPGWTPTDGLGSARGAFVTDYEYDYLRHRIPPRHLETANPLQFMLLDATEQALGEAGTINREETTVLVGSTFGGDFSNQLLAGMSLPEFRRELKPLFLDAGWNEDRVERLLDQYEERFLEHFPALTDETGSFTSSTLASRITKLFDLRGGALALEAGPASSGLALGTGMSLLRGGVCSSVVCAGAQRSMDAATFESLAAQGSAIDFAPGEGVGVVVLRRLSDAITDGNPIFAMLRGWGTAYTPDSPSEAVVEAATRAFAQAGIDRGRRTATEVLSMDTDDLGPSISQADPATTLRTNDLHQTTGYLGAAHDVVALIHSTDSHLPDMLGTASASRTGLANHLLMGPAPHALPAGTRELRFGGASFADLAEQLLYPAENGVAGFASSDVCRVGIRVDDPSDLAQRVHLGLRHFESPEQRHVLAAQGVFVAETRRPAPRVAFVFSGQGSQYPGMFKDVVRHSPAAQVVLEEADQELARQGLGSFEDLAWGGPERLNEDPVTTQLSVLVADSIMFAAITEAGIEADCVAGHSFGEIAALVAVRSITLTEAIRVTIRRAEALRHASPDGGLVSVRASRSDVEGLLDGWDGRVFLTHHNAPLQTVVGGRKPDLAEFAAFLKGRGVAHLQLKVPGALHSPLVSDACPHLRAALEEVAVRPPTRLFYSGVSCDVASTVDDIVENLVAQLVTPVAYPGLIDRLLADGVGILIEIGPKQVLTGIHRDMVPGIVTALPSDPPRGSVWDQFDRIRLALTVQGIDASPVGHRTSAPRPGALFEFDATEPRRLRMRNEPVQLSSNDPGRNGSSSAATSAPTEARLNSPVARLLLDHVVDLTGYPRDAIRLDWDLEADLGLDSIKRTQLVGELAESFDFDPTAAVGAELATATTLGAIIDLLDNGSAASAPVPAPIVVESDPADLDFERGWEAGRQYRDQVRNRLREMALTGQQNGTMMAHPEAVEASELRVMEGLARGAGVHLDNVIAYRHHNGILPVPEVGPDESRRTDGPRHAAGTNGSAAETGEQISFRYVMRAEPLPRIDADAGHSSLDGPALVLGSGPIANALVARLVEAGLATERIEELTPEAALARLESIWTSSQPLHLFLAPDGTETPDTLQGSDWVTRRERALMLPFLICQRWLTLVLEAGRVDEASLLAVTRLGGDFGFSSAMSSFETGNLTGLMKAVLIESWVSGHRHFPVKVIDVNDAEDPTLVADTAIRELLTPSYEAEVGLVDGVRHVVRAREEALPEIDSDAAVDLGHRWVCTGGARGITAWVAEQLGDRFDLELHLVGRAELKPLPSEWKRLWTGDRRSLKVMVMDAARDEGENPVKAWEKAQKLLEIEESLARLERRGISVSYHSCDVSDREALSAVLDEVRKHGPIDGILHGAGAGRDARFADKEPARVDECYRAKVDGTLALMELTHSDPLRFFVAFGSVSGRYGANGHADYSSANDMMAKLVDWYRGQRPKVAAVTFHWHAWGDVGMATKAETQLGLQMVDMRFMPAREGAEHLIRELHAGAPHSEVLITDPRYRARFQSDEAARQVSANGDGSTAEILCPLLFNAIEDRSNGSRILELSFNPARESFLNDHRLDGTPLLPLAVSLEMMAEAGASSANGTLRLTDVEALDGLRFPSDQPRPLRLVTHRRDNEADVELRTDHTARDGTILERDRVIVRSRVSAVEAGQLPNGFELHEAINASDIDQLPPHSGWSRYSYQNGEGRLHVGPTFHAIRRIHMDDAGLWATITAPALVELAGVDRPGSGWRLNPAVIDACLHATGVLGWHLTGQASLPRGFEQLEVGRMPTPRETCLFRVVPDGPPESGRFAFALFGHDRRPILSAKGYALTWLTLP